MAMGDLWVPLEVLFGCFLMDGVLEREKERVRRRTTWLTVVGYAERGNVLMKKRYLVRTQQIFMNIIVPINVLYK